MHYFYPLRMQEQPFRLPSVERVAHNRRAQALAVGTVYPQLMRPARQRP